MDTASFQRLLQINRDFYAATADDFAGTRASGWRGWARLLPHLPPARPLRVLDVGCGNARLADYLAERLNRPIDYTGIDNSPRLLGLARDRVRVDARIRPVLLEQDALLDPLPDGPFDLVAAFGFVHHIPGLHRRQASLAELAQRVAPGGVLAVTLWKFYEYERFRARIVPWSQIARPPATLEAGDHLLDWRAGQTALRYCHYVDEQEEAALIAATRLPLIDRYRSDGEGGRVNAYLIWRRVSS
ncbi:MAG: class I SAM-dependent methyltransferase [Candidatus Flexifilum sp.]